MIKKMWPLLLGLIVAISCEADAEKLGDLSIEEVFVHPQFEAKEPSEGSFSVLDSYLHLSWTKKGGIGAHIKVGSQSLKNVPVYFQSTPLSELGFFEAYGFFHGVYGDISMGLVPIGYSIEGNKSESQLLLPRSLLFRERWTNLRDLGLSFRSSFSGWMSQVTVHNGEGGTAQDGKTWTTMQWGWTDQEYFTWQVSAMAGGVDPLAMSQSQTTLAGLDKTQDVFWRIGGVSLEWNPHRWYSTLEFHYGEKEQNGEIIKFATGHFDMAYRFAGDWQIIVRWDQMDPNGVKEGDQVTEYSLAFAFYGENSNSRVMLVATAVEEESLENNNNRILLEWRLTPISK